MSDMNEEGRNKVIYLPSFNITAMGWIATHRGPHMISSEGAE
jgi:hypothetical protein